MAHSSLPVRHARPPARPRMIAAAALMASLAACATNPVTGRRELAMMSEAQEIETGRQADAEIRREMRLYDDAALQRYVSDIGLRLAATSHRPQLPWQFAVVDVTAVNAFALPGGFVYVTRGLLPYLSSEADLAGVIGHEIGHVTARHAVQQYSKAMGGQIGLIGLGIFVPSTRPFSGMADFGLQVLFMKYGRDDELQADELGVEYAARQEWDPRGVRNMLGSLARLDEGTDRRGIPNWLSTHPAPVDRVAQITPAVEARAAGRSSWVVRQDEYYARLDGLVFGDNPEDGIVRDSLFLHPSLRLSIAFPEDWTINNGAEQVVAKNPSADQYMLLREVVRPQGTTLAEIARQHSRDIGLRGDGDGRAAVLNGNEAHVAPYTGSMPSVGTVRVLGAHVRVGRRVFFVAGMARAEGFASVSPVFDRTFHSVRELTAREASDLRPNVVRFHTVRAGDTWQSIAAREGGNVVRASVLAVINGHAVNEQPAPGSRIKIVVAGN